MNVASNIMARDPQHRATTVNRRELSTQAKGPQDRTVAVLEMFSHHCSSSSSGRDKQMETKQSRTWQYMPQFLGRGLLDNTCNMSVVEGGRMERTWLGREGSRGVDSWWKTDMSSLPCLLCLAFLWDMRWRDW